MFGFEDKIITLKEEVIILIFALAIPISIVFLVYRTLFSGLNSISSSKRPAKIAEDAAAPEPAQNINSIENEAG
jgi:hypothetical protein